MSERRSLQDQAFEAMSSLREVKKLANPFNDFGSILFVRDEIGLIERELSESLSRIELRCMYLRQRITKWESGDREVGRLKE